MTAGKCFSNVLPHHLEQYLAQSRYSIIVNICVNDVIGTRDESTMERKSLCLYAPNFEKKENKTEGKKAK